MSSLEGTIMRAFNPTILAFVLAVGFGDSATPVFADNVGGTCVPDSATIRAGQYETAGFGVRFGGDSVGTIRLLCPYRRFTFDFDVTISGMEMSVIDQDGMEAGGRIRASLHRAVRGTNVWIDMGTCDSNTSNTTTPHKIICVVNRFYTIKGDEWIWWDIKIERTTPRVNVEFLGIEMLYLAEDW
jgi:hypothetical protein